MVTTDEHELRQEICATALDMARQGLSPQRSGNVSARYEDGFLITPSGLPYEDTGADDIVRIKAGGFVPEGQRKPSSETPFHQAIYDNFPTAQAIVHCHSVCATAVACARLEIPAFHYMVAVAGGKKIPLAEYATFGTDALAKSAVAALEGHKACLLANHGQIAYADRLHRALELAAEVETLATEYLEVLKIGQVHLLDDAEMDRVLEQFKGYGR